MDVINFGNGQVTIDEYGNIRRYGNLVNSGDAANTKIDRGEFVSVTSALEAKLNNEISILSDRLNAAISILAKNKIIDSMEDIDILAKEMKDSKIVVDKLCEKNK